MVGLIKKYMEDRIVIKNKITSTVLVLILIFISTGCSVFQSKQRLDITPFANSMIAVAGEIQYSLFQARTIHITSIKPGAELKRFVVYRTKLRDIIKSTISYSIEIVTLSESNATGKEKCSALADYIDGVRRPVLAHPQMELNISPDRIDEIIADIRKQEKLLDGLAAAQPIIDEVAIITGDLSDILKEYLDLAAYEMNEQWKNKYSEILWAENELRDGQVAALKALYHLKNYRIGKSETADSVFIYDPQLTEIVKDQNKISKTDIMELEKRLIYKLSGLNEMRKEFKDDINMYYKGMNELELVKGTYNVALRDARNAIILWSRAHSALSKGVTDPAEIDILGLMMKAASVAPVPGV